MTERRAMTERRNLNPTEMYSLGFTEMGIDRDDEGWPYPDDDDEETTETRWALRGGLYHKRRRG